VNSAIGTSCSDEVPGGTRDLLQRRLDDSLNGSTFGLDLPAQEIRAVVVQNQPNAYLLPRIHAVKVETTQGMSRMTPE
jgi:hypothetical protein